LAGNKRIAAIANTTFDGGLGGAYGGAGEGATSSLLPLIVVDNYGVTSIVGLQNTDIDSAQDVDLSCTGQDASEFTLTFTVQAGASRIIDLAGEVTDTIFADPDPDTAAGWIGGCVVAPDNGTTPFVASAMNYANTFVYAYSGVAGTIGDTYYLPLIRSGFGGPVTGVQVVDANQATNGDTTIDVEYSGFVDINGNYVEDSGEAYTCNVQATLPDNSSITFFNSGTTDFTVIFGGSGTATVTGGDCQTNGDANFDAAGGFFLGGAEVVASGSTDPAIAVVVNDSPLAGGSSGAYLGFQASDAGAEVISPLSRNDFYDITTGTQIQNISASTVTVVAKYSTSPLSLNATTPPDYTQDIGPGKSFTFFLPTQWGATSAEEGWLGSVIVGVTGSTDPALVGITNDAPAAGDSSVFETIFVE
jgi:hypothetical protein